MIQEKDYVLRLVRQIAELLAKALKLRVEKKDDEAEILLAGAVLDVLGIELKTLELVDSASGAAVLGSPARVIAFAQLLEAMGEGDSAKARSRRQHALELYLEAKDADGIARLRDRVDLTALPARYQMLMPTR